MKLYEIADEYQNIFNELSESGEFNNELIENTLSPITKSFEEKAKNVVSYINNLNYDIEVLKEHEKNIASRRKSYEKEVENYRNYLKINMIKCKIKSLKCSLFNVLIKNSIPKLVINDEMLIPTEYIRTKTITEIDTDKLKSDLKNGIIIQGAELLPTSAITIKLK